MVWQGRRGLVRSGVARCGAAQLGVDRRGVARRGVARQGFIMSWQEQQRERYKQQQAEKARAEQQEAEQQRLLLKSQFEEQQRIAAEQSAIRERQTQEKLRIEKQQQDVASLRIADGLKLQDAQRQERLRLAREKNNVCQMPTSQPNSVSKKGLRVVKHDNSGLNLVWDLGRIVIILLTILWVLGSVITGFSFIITSILPILTGLGILFTYETWYLAKHPPQKYSHHDSTNVPKYIQARYLWKSPQLRIGSIILVVILITGTIFYFRLPHTNPASHSNSNPISFPPSLNGKGVLVLNDTLRDQASNGNWVVDSPFCSFTDSYHAWSVGNEAHLCFAHNTNFANFVFQVEMFFVKADDSFGGGGIIFRADSLNSQYYGFFITKAGDGELFISSSSGSENRLILKKDRIQRLETSDNQINLIEVVAIGDHIQVYVNKIIFADVTDDTYSHGQIGVFVQGTQISDFSIAETEVAFFNAKVWKL